MQKLQEHQDILVRARNTSHCSLLLHGKRKNGAEAPRTSPGILASSMALWCHEHCTEARAEFHIFLFAKFTVLQHTEIPQMSVNLKYGLLPAAAVLSWRLTAEVVNNLWVFMRLG